MRTAGRSAEGRPPHGRFRSAKAWFLLPAVIWTCGFTLFPLCYALWLSLQQSRGMGRPLEFAGLKGWGRLFGDERVWGSLSFTLGYALVTVTAQILLGLGLALLVNREFRLRGLVRTLLLLPLFATPVGLGYLGRIIYADNGPINVSLDALFGFGELLTGEALEVLAFGCLSPHHATQFKAFHKLVRSKFALAAILKGDTGWPHRPEDRDVLYFLVQSFRAQLCKELPPEKKVLAESHRELVVRAKVLLRDLAAMSLEMAQMVVSKDSDGPSLPNWFMVEVVRDLPRLVAKGDAA